MRVKTRGKKGKMRKGKKNGKGKSMREM